MIRYNVRTGVKKIKTKSATSISIAVLGIAGLGSSLAFIPALSHAASGNSSPNWHVGYYNPSGRALSFSQAQNTSSGLASFNFTNGPNTALLVTDQGSQKGNLLGDLSKDLTVTANYMISSATGEFQYYGERDACGSPASVRLFFETSNAGGFDYTHYWWSNPWSKPLSSGPNTVTSSLDSSNWSDWNGQNGATQQDGFNNALKNVTTIGLSFGGGCFFENGVGTSDGSGVFTLNSYTVTPLP